jgi:hypothetical protein
MSVPFTFYEIKQTEEVCPLSPLSQAFTESPLYSQDEDSVKFEVLPGTYVTGQSSKVGTFRKRVREDLKSEVNPMGPPKLQRQHATSFHRNEIKEESKEEDDEDKYIPMPGNKDYDKKPSYHRKNVSPFGNYIFNYKLERVAPIPNESPLKLSQYQFRHFMINDMEFIKRLIYDYETHIDYNGCREERLKQYRVLDQLMHFNQLDKLYEPTGEEACMNPPPSPTFIPNPDDCFHSSPFETSPDKCDNILHDHNSK